MGGSLKRSFLMILLFFSQITYGAEAMKDRSQEIIQFFNAINATNLKPIQDFYDKNVQFEDPVGHMQGLDKLTKYYENMYKNVQEIRFDFTKTVRQENTYVMYWTMHLKAKGLKGGDEVTVDGNSLIEYGGSENKVIFHRDYFDMGAFVYEHIPVLGFAVRRIKAHLKSE